MFRSGENSSPTRKGALSIGRIPTNRDVVRAGGSRRRLRAGRPPYGGHMWERHSRTRRCPPLSAGSISPGVVPSPNAPQRPSTRIGPKRDIGSRRIRAHGIMHAARITARHEATPVRRRKVVRVANAAAEVFFSPRPVLGLPHVGQWLRIYHGTHRTASGRQRAVDEGRNELRPSPNIQERVPNPHPPKIPKSQNPNPQLPDPWNLKPRFHSPISIRVCLYADEHNSLV